MAARKRYLRSTSISTCASFIDASPVRELFLSAGSRVGGEILVLNYTYIWCGRPWVGIHRLNGRSSSNKESLEQCNISFPSPSLPFLFYCALINESNLCYT